ncbi:hypothetical protein EVAR_33349_1 [Eumeta japonica]|uniref:Uncharacterized protein n=1 Tax=Eumeta variegata TaxID=151549 RepID=A0A4C1YI40_EUMVA|nr:hypothetical protein EVAR_33349_1 [Eumeta japonica]
MSIIYMAAYSTTNGLVALDEKKTDGILSAHAREDWVVPDITWVNEVPGCGNTTWVVKYFELGRGVIINTTRESARDLKKKLASRLRADANGKVRTTASVMVNSFRGAKRCDRLIVDEVLMNQFGNNVLATRIVRSLRLERFSDDHPKRFLKHTLTYTQVEKKFLITKGFGIGLTECENREDGHRSSHSLEETQQRTLSFNVRMTVCQRLLVPVSEFFSFSYRLVIRKSDDQEWIIISTGSRLYRIHLSGVGIVNVNEYEITDDGVTKDEGIHSMYDAIIMFLKKYGFCWYGFEKGTEIRITVDNVIDRYER